MPATGDREATASSAVGGPHLAGAHGAHVVALVVADVDENVMQIPAVPPSSSCHHAPAHPPCPEAVRHAGAQRAAPNYHRQPQSDVKMCEPDPSKHATQGNCTHSDCAGGKSLWGPGGGGGVSSLQFEEIRTGITQAVRSSWADTHTLARVVHANGWKSACERFLGPTRSGGA